MENIDPKSKELDELNDIEEERIQQEFGCCPGPVDLWTANVNRRGFLKVGMGGLLSLLFAQWLDPRAALAQAAAGKKAKACILLWMNGGPSHLDTWDPKPGAATGGPFKSIKTRASGIEICEHLPMVADHTDKMAIVRGMTTKEGNHQRAQYLMHTGYVPNPTISHPSFGGWVSEELGDPNNDLPNFVSISGPSIGAGFLGVQYGPLVVNNINQPLQNVHYAFNVNDSRFAEREKALNMLESQFAAETGDTKVKGRQAVYGKAVRLMRSPKLKAFDIAEEPEAVKAAYGDSNFGRGCLMARRLVESGVKFVEVVLDGWDTHQDNFTRTTKLMGTLDPAMASLMKDLADRNLLDSTLIICMGEFGRTPKINANDGRDHFPGAWSAVMAGGGVRGGTVYGQTDDTGTKVVDKPVVVADFYATVATLLGMSPSKTFQTPVGRPISITEKGNPIHDLIV
jgi:uncharacterized protein (DUF1501 family)